MNNFLEIKEAIPRDKFNRIQDFILSDSFPWFYTSTTINNSSAETNFSFFHSAYHYETDYSFIGKDLADIVTECMSTTNVKINNLLRLRLGLITSTPTKIVHTPHIDFSIPHHTGLLYFNNADGETFLYDEKYDTSVDKKDYDKYVRSKENTILTKTIPEENKVFVFDGLHYHSSSSPTVSDRRVVLTFNYV
jgi:hypothetical protein